MNPINEALQKMNSYGKSGTPFLFILDYELQMPIVLKLSELSEAGILFDFNGINNCKSTSVPEKSILEQKKESRVSSSTDFTKKSTSVPTKSQADSPLSPIISSTPISFEEYLKSFNIVQENLQKGNTYLANLTFSTQIKLRDPLEAVFRQVKAKYKLFMRNKFLVFSPETFMQIKACQISTFPMKGTIEATLKDAPAIIIDDEKEIAEHVTVVDLLRNDLSRVASSVRVKKFRYIDEIATGKGALLQVSSEISGQLPIDYKSRLGDIIFKLLPAGSITGAPKKKVQEIIEEAEREPRGFYTGVCGLFDGDNLDSGVMIRFIEQRAGELYYHSGGGITINSEASKEYKELKDKIYLPIG